MKIICNQHDLLSSINIAQKAVPSKSTMPVLECLLIEAYDGSIKISSSNMELSIETYLTGRIDIEGQVALNAKIFSEIVRKLPDDRVTIEVDQQFVTYIYCGPAKFKISGLLGDDFPKIPNYNKNDYINISQLSLKDIIRQTIFSIGDESRNRVMTGEHFEISDNVLTMTSLDGHRISIRKTTLKENYAEKDIVIPGKTLSDISKLLSDDIESEVTIYFSENNIIFEFENTIVLSRLVEGKYLNVKQMINNDYDTCIRINKKMLYECFDRASLLVRESEKKPIIIGIYDGKINLNMNTSIGSLDEEIEVEKEGKDLLIGFNPKFLMDVIKVIDDEEITIYLTNAKAPCFIRDEQGTYNYIVLPVNFNSVQ